MYTCPHCGNRTVEATRTHTLYETMILRYTDDQGSYEEEDAGSFGDSIDQTPWKERTCTDCDSTWPDEPALPEPTPTVFVLFGSERFLCGVYRTRHAATEAIRTRVLDTIEEPQGSPQYQWACDEYEIIEQPLR